MELKEVEVFWTNPNNKKIDPQTTTIIWWKAETTILHAVDIWWYDQPNMSSFKLINISLLKGKGQF